MNIVLREHVTSVGFSLTLSKRQIEAMFHIEKMIKLNETFSSGSSHFITTSRALAERGLVEFHQPPEQCVTELIKKGASKETIYKIYGVRYRWRLTKAGELMLGLLREAGMEEQFECKHGKEAAA